VGVPSTESAELERGMEVEVKSPCNGVCRLNIFNVCKGCKRTREEVSKWYVMSNAEKQQVVDRVKK
jgi:predicted Fe-S protein YdhL (DUF1289 family)